jgi:hypothetical protein
MTKAFDVRQLVRPRGWLWLVALPLGILTAYVYFWWYHVLVARGFGYVLNSVRYAQPFETARVLLLCWVVIGFATYWLARGVVSKGWRGYFVVMMGLAAGALIVPEIIVSFGPEPWWHH